MSSWRRWLPVVVAVLVVALPLTRWAKQRWQTEQELAATERLGTALTQRFHEARALKVATLSGTVTARASDTRFFDLVTSQSVTRSPYSVDYFVDLSQLDTGHLRWDARRRVLVVEVPEVTVAAPNIREDQAQRDVSGPFVTRQAQEQLTRRSGDAAASRTLEAARDPANLARARDSARRAVAALAKAPLAAAGQEGVTVTVRFPSDPPLTAERWDTSRTIAEVLGSDALGETRR